TTTTTTTTTTNNNNNNNNNNNAFTTTTTTTKHHLTTRKPKNKTFPILFIVLLTTTTTTTTTAAATTTVETEKAPEILPALENPTHISHPTSASASVPSDVYSSVGDDEKVDEVVKVLRRTARHFSRLDVCDDAVCDQMVRQANSLARFKMVRRYIVQGLSTLDSLVTALDAELVVAGESMARALGNRCRTAHAILSDVTRGPEQADRLNGKSSAFIYGQDIVNNY
ncbi:TNF receptor-associated factor family protein DDB_G0272098-like, partial [Portunus trituberculatus]|uniref:TNF receptor-associated factor family protein DDB_G0272098-like n=1 Tax=Portunus trituberculatus TaxID=210409 RepID=UPI001E1D004C